MTDITRPSNPALSFSSLTDDTAVYRQVILYHDRIEILSPSPRTTITADSLEEPDDGRSKSAPPNPIRSQLEDDKIVDNIVVLSSAFDPPLRPLARSDSAPPKSTNSDDSQTSNFERDPDISLRRILRTPPATPSARAFAGSSSFGGGVSLVAAAFENRSTFGVLQRLDSTNSTTSSSSSSSSSSSDCVTTTNAEEDIRIRRSFVSPQEQQQEDTLEQPLEGRRQLSRPIAQSPRSRLSTSLLLQQQQEQSFGVGGTLILRPNPVKAAEIDTANLSPEQLVQAAAAAIQVVAEAVVEDNTVEYQPRAYENTENETSKKQPLPKESNTDSKAFRRRFASSAEQKAKRKLSEARLERIRKYQIDFPENNNTPVTMVSSFAERENTSHHNESSANFKQAPPRNPSEAHMRQTQQQNHRDRMNSLRASSGAESLGNRNRNNEEMHADTGASRGVQPTPLFERLVTEEVQELKTYAGIVERQNVELAKQKKVQEDLEARLRGETRRRKELEKLLEEQERVWSEKFVELEQERNAAEKKLLDEQSKTKKLIDQVQRKDRDIHDFFKKKYDHDGGRAIRGSVRGGVSAPTERNPQSSTASAARLAEFPLQSPQQLLNNLGSDEKVREGNAKNLLLDFFGI